MLGQRRNESRGSRWLTCLHAWSDSGKEETDGATGMSA
jgi:hypothetical protein